MQFETYANRVMSLNDFTSQIVKKIQQISNKKDTEIRMPSISKSQFAGLMIKYLFS